MPSEKPKHVNHQQHEDKIHTEIENEKTVDSKTKEVSKKKEDKKKKWILIGIIIFLLLSVVSFVFYYSNKNKGNNSSSQSGNKGSFTLIKESGKVSYKSENSEYKELTDDEIGLNNKSFIKTEEGLAHVLFANNSLLSIDKNSEVQILLDNDDIGINQLAGSTWNRVKKLTSSESYKVESPTALATVRGTKFGVELGKDPASITGIYTIEGKVGVGQKDGDKVNTLPDLVEYPAFTEVKFKDKENPINKGNLLPEGAQGRWYQRNRVIDKIYDETADLGSKLSNLLKTNSKLLEIDKNNSGPTRKENCLELLDQKEVVKQDKTSVKILKPTEGQVFTTKDTVNFETDSFNPCTQNPFDDKLLTWYLNDSKDSFGSGKTASQVNLPEGNYYATVRGQYNKNIYEDKVNFVVKDSSSSSSSSSLVSSSKTTSSSSSSAKFPPKISRVIPASGGVYHTTNYDSSFASIPPDTYFYKQTVNFSAAATDGNTGTSIPGANIAWFANDPLHGNPGTFNQIGTGSSLSYDFHTPYNKTTSFIVKVKITNISDSLSSTQQINFTVTNP